MQVGHVAPPVDLGQNRNSSAMKGRQQTCSSCECQEEEKELAMLQHQLLAKL